MYALLPAFVSSLFLFYGIHVLMTRGRTRAGLAFVGVTVLTCLWQGLWAFLFEAPDVATARVLARLGWAGWRSCRCRPCCITSCSKWRSAPTTIAG